MRQEISKFVKNNRISEISLKDLDAKVQIELYLREKKEAILDDRKDEDEA